MTPRPSFSRQMFLSLIWKGSLLASGMLGLVGIFRFLSHQSDPAQPTEFDLGVPEGFPPDTRSLIPAAQAVIVSTSSGLRAFSITCPHLGCLVDLAPEGFRCPCHGSRFDLDGNPTQGPANTPLRRLHLELNIDQHLVLSIED